MVIFIGCARKGADVSLVAAFRIGLAVEHIGARANDCARGCVATCDNGRACTGACAEQPLFQRCVATGRKATEGDTCDRRNFENSHLLLPLVALCVWRENATLLGPRN